MSDHMVVSVNRLITTDTSEVRSKSVVSALSANCKGHSAESSNSVEREESEENSLLGEEEPLIQLECRICQEEDSVKNLEAPCTCNGSLKFAHRKCVQKWCNEKGDIICEICHQPYQPGYTAPPPAPSDETAINISEWTVTGAPLDLNDPRFLAMAAAERQLLEAEYEEYADNNANGAAFCRSAALILMALLLLRHALYVTDPNEEEDDISTFFSIFLLRAAGFLLPCYIMAWAISILQRRRERQEAAALSAGEIAYVIQAGQNREVHFTIAPAGTAVAHHPEPLQPI